VIAPVMRVLLACACGHEWIAAHVQEGAWWTAPPATIAAQSYCPRCDHAPPMRVVRVTP